jgi:trk system potassium uptake protein TrkH
MNVVAFRERLSFGSWSPPYLRPVLQLVARMLIALSGAMLLPAVADVIVWNPDSRAFLLGSGVTLACGGGLHYLTRCRLSGGLTIRQAFVLTPRAWTAIALFGALPLYISDYAQLKDNFTNAFFESMSGLTTTGSTVIVGLDAAPPGVLLWRAILQWLGGIGIIGVAIAILPALGVGGMQIFSNGGVRPVGEGHAARAGDRNRHHPGLCRADPHLWIPVLACGNDAFRSARARAHYPLDGRLFHL